MGAAPKLLVTRAETYALECAIRHYRNTKAMLRNIGLDEDPAIARAGDEILADLRYLRRRLTDGRPRQTYK